MSSRAMPIIIQVLHDCVVKELLVCFFCCFIAVDGNQVVTRVCVEKPQVHWIAVAVFRNKSEDAVQILKDC